MQEDGEEEEEEPSEKGSDTDRLLDEPTTTAQVNEDLQDVWVTAGDGPEGSTVQEIMARTTKAAIRIAYWTIPIASKSRRSKLVCIWADISEICLSS